MAFNARWELESLAEVRGLALPDLLTTFGLDLAALVRTCEVFRLGVADSGNRFRLLGAQGAETQPPSEPGLYVIFSPTQLLYCGEAKNLRRRQLDDPDNTADSTKRFSNQGRAVLKLVLHRGWAGRLGLDPVFMQLFAASAKLQDAGETLESRYHVSRFSKALEAAAALFVHGLHQEMVGRARALGHAGV